ncbi:MAG: hypothetical protein NT135_02215, partial [Candidatus Berkelbacteria bacterium]|nr:hypothetical protein [Candidatus Berkelbacteria bacterium]
MEQTTSIANWWDTVVFATSDAWAKILSFLPNLIGAFVIILIGLLFAYIFKWIIVQVFNAVRLQVLSDKSKFTDVLSKMGIKEPISELLGNLVKWIVIIVFLMPALEVLGMSQVSDILQVVLSYLPNVVVAGFLIFIGIVVAEFVAHVIKATALTIGTATATILASLARYSVLVFVSLMALEQLGVASNMLLSLFTGFVAMIAIAGGLAFGLGGKDAAADLIKR